MKELWITQTDGKIHHALGLEALVLSKHDSTTQCNLRIQCNPYQITNGISYKTRTTTTTNV